MFDDPTRAGSTVQKGRRRKANTDRAITQVSGKWENMPGRTGEVKSLKFRQKWDCHTEKNASLEDFEQDVWRVQSRKELMTGRDGLGVGWRREGIRNVWVRRRQVRGWL